MMNPGEITMRGQAQDATAEKEEGQKEEGRSSDCMASPSLAGGPTCDVMMACAHFERMWHQEKRVLFCFEIECPVAWDAFELTM